ncbi:MAG: hypothetical protein H6740_13670 [Alphaproteobacteria bacterium]|nr:hypothetical protein [Alphaproteobacteria bacterium]
MSTQLPANQKEHASLSPLDRAVKDSLPANARGFRDEWMARLLALLVSGLSVWLTHLKILDISKVSGALAGGLLALMAVGASSVMAGFPMLLSHEFDLVKSDPDRARQAIRNYVAVHWNNLKWLMINSILACVASLGGALINPELSQLVGSYHLDLVPAALLPWAVIMGVRRWWLTVRSFFDVTFTSIDAQFSRLKDQKDPGD